MNKKSMYYPNLSPKKKNLFKKDMQLKYHRIKPMIPMIII